MVITGTTGNRVYPKRVPRVQIPPAPPKMNEANASFFFYPSSRLGISSDASRYIIKGGSPPLYLITRQRASFLRLDDIQTFGLMIYRNRLRMIYKACALIYFREYIIINSPKIQDLTRCCYAKISIYYFERCA